MGRAPKGRGLEPDRDPAVVAAARVGAVVALPAGRERVGRVVAVGACQGERGLDGGTVACLPRIREERQQGSVERELRQHGILRWWGPESHSGGCPDNCEAHAKAWQANGPVPEAF